MAWGKSKPQRVNGRTEVKGRGLGCPAGELANLSELETVGQVELDEDHRRLGGHTGCVVVASRRVASSVVISLPVPPSSRWTHVSKDFLPHAAPIPPLFPPPHVFFLEPRPQLQLT